MVFITEAIYRHSHIILCNSLTRHSRALISSVQHYSPCDDVMTIQLCFWFATAERSGVSSWLVFGVFFSCEQQKILITSHNLRDVKHGEELRRAL